MPLAAFAKTFDLQEVTKGFFPHFFNTPDRQDYVGNLPGRHYYHAEGMSSRRRRDFDSWYTEQLQLQQRNPQQPFFHLHDQLIAYCHSDVLLLKQGCLRFAEDFQQLAHFNPFSKITIASACSWDLRRNRLRAATIASEPVTGWRRKVNHSRGAIEWLEWLQYTHGIQLEHARNVGEHRVKGTTYTVDGYHPSSHTAYEYLGCFWHGCPDCYSGRCQTHRQLLDRSMADAHEATNRRHDVLRQQGYRVVTMRECQWKRHKEQDAALHHYIDQLQLQDPLVPREAFFGGRTNAIRLYYQIAAGETIRYYDYTNLYPWVNKTGRYPISHPHVIYAPQSTDLSAYFGLAKITILPPYHLFHPVLPVRSGGKLTFPLCQACTVANIDLPVTLRDFRCPHNDSQRSLVGTWCTPEIAKAVAVGYRILKVHEVWHFYQTQQGLFANYVNTWLKIKEEASGWPSGCDTPQQHLQNYQQHEHIALDPDRIAHNPGKRALAKLMLNSMWGKFGQRTDQTKHREFTRLQDFHTFLTTEGIDVRYVSPLTDKRVEVHYKDEKDYIEASPNLNIFIACFATCWARLRLYEALELVGDRILYFDTDSVVFIDRPGTPKPTLGNYLGDFKDELSHNDYIVEFSAGGPKNYGYITASGTTVCKVRGFSLNCEGSRQLNYNVLKHNVLNEVADPQPEPRTIDVVTQHKIQRDAKQYRLTTAPQTKQYRLVFNKRVLDTDTLISYPYGYAPA